MLGDTDRQPSADIEMAGEASNVASTDNPVFSAEVQTRENTVPVFSAEVQTRENTVDLLPASTALPKLRTALKMSGYGMPPRVVPPLLLLDVIGLGFGALAVTYMPWMGQDVRDPFIIFLTVSGFVSASYTAHLHKHVARADGLGALDTLEKLRVTPDVRDGAAGLKIAELWAGQAPSSPITMLVIILACELLPATPILEWPNETTRMITWASMLVGQGCGYFPHLYACAAASIACCAIVRDQLRQATHRLEKLASDCATSTSDVAFDFRATMRELHDLMKHTKQCERIDRCILGIGLYNGVLGGTIWSYFAIFSYAGPVFKAASTFVTCVVYGQALSLLMAMFSVTAGWFELYSATCNLRFGLPIDRQHEVNALMTIFRDANVGQGPGFKLYGIIVDPKLVQSVAGFMVSVVVGSVWSTMVEYQASTSTSTGSSNA